jgi:1-acyl-sn-glycerol-3-phosphate acyltransferase
LALLAVATVLTFAGWTLGTLAVLPFADARRRVRQTVFRRWARAVLRILRVRVSVQGTPPSGAFFLVSNHLSYLDIAVFARLLDARFVAKREVRGWPGVGLLARTMGTIFIDRSVRRDAVRALDAVAEAIDGGEGVVVFAEATSTAGQLVLPFRPALLEWAARTGHPVHCASIEYRTPAGSPPAHLAVCWWGDMPFGAHLAELARLPLVEATVRFGDETIAEPDRKRLAGRLHEAVTAQFIPVVVE